MKMHRFHQRIDRDQHELIADDDAAHVVAGWYRHGLGQLAGEAVDVLEQRRFVHALHDTPKPVLRRPKADEGPG